MQFFGPSSNLASHFCCKSNFNPALLVRVNFDYTCRKQTWYFESERNMCLPRVWNYLKMCQTKPFQKKFFFQQGCASKSKL